MSRATRAALLALAAAAGAPRAHAQRLADFAVERPRQQEPSLASTIRFGAGSFTIAAADSGTLYRARLRYDSDRFRPASTFEPSPARFDLWLAEREGRRSGRTVQQGASLAFSPVTPLDLTVELGAAEARLALGDLSVRRLDLRTGASTTRVRWDAPNRVACESATLQAGAAELTVEGLGHSRCTTVTLQGGAGEVLLDFDGLTDGLARVSATLTAGSLVLRVPKGTGIRMHVDGTFTSVDAPGLRKGDGVWATDGYTAARRRLDITARTVLGGVRVEWQ